MTQLSNGHYRAIGRISVAFSDLETWTNAFLWQLIGDDQLVGQIVTSKASFRNALDMFSALFRHRFEDSELREKCDAVLAELSAVGVERNTIVHSTWLYQSMNREEATRFKIMAPRKKGLSQAKQVMTPAQLEEIADGIEVANRHLSDLMIPLVGGEVRQ